MILAMEKNYALKRAAYAPLASSTPFRKQRFLTGFTLVEILVAIIILTVLASLSIATYQKTVTTYRDTICLQNLQVLQTAIDIYTLEKDTLPTTLSQLEPRHIYLAYEKVVGKQKENSFLVFLRNRFGIKPVWAQSLGKYYGNNPRVLKCPSDTPSSSLSYVINPDETQTKKCNGTKCKLKKDSVYALIYDTAERHTDTAGVHANGITPGGVKGKLISLTDKKVKKAKDCGGDDELDDDDCGATTTDE